MKFFSWIIGSKKMDQNDLERRIEKIMSGQKYQKLPSDIRQLDDSYRALIRELAKRD